MSARNTHVNPPRLEARLLKEGAHYVGLTVAAFYKRRGGRDYRGLERDDLVAAANLGLVEAARQFDPTRGVQWKTFAILKIKKRILEEIRRCGPLKRTQFARYQALGDAQETLQARLEREPTAEEIAAYLGIRETTLAHWRQIGLPVSLDAIPTTSPAHDADPLQETLAAEDDLLESVLTQERAARLQAALARLPEREREVVTRYHFEGLTYKALGAALGVSESRVYQLYAKGVQRLRKALESDYREGLL